MLMYHYALPVRCGLSRLCRRQHSVMPGFRIGIVCNHISFHHSLGGGNKHIDSLSVIVNNRLVLCPDNTGRSQ